MGKRELCRSKRHPLTKDNLILSKDRKRRCLACWWESKLSFIEAFNRSKATGVTNAPVSQLVDWSAKAQQVVKIAETALEAAARLAREQDLRLFIAKRRFRQAKERFDKIVQVAHEISEVCKLKAND